MDSVNFGIYIPILFFVLYFILEIQDLGICAVSVFISRNQEENKAALGLLKPGFDGNEFWLLLGTIGLGAGIYGGIYDCGMIALVLGVAGLGMLSRCGAPFLRNVFKSKIMMGLLSVLAIINVFVVGMVFFSLSEHKIFNFSLYTLLGCIWLIIISIQTGSLYGAVKVVNPLGERFRASSLVITPISLLIFLILAVYSFLSTNFMEGSQALYVWGSIFSILLLVVSFITLRMRKLWMGFLLGYLYQIIAIVTISFSVFFRIAGNNTGNGMLTLGTELQYPLMVIGGIISGTEFIYRIVRKKEQYIWSDYL